MTSTLSQSSGALPRTSPLHENYHHHEINYHDYKKMNGHYNQNHMRKTNSDGAGTSSSTTTRSVRWNWKQEELQHHESSWRRRGDEEVSMSWRTSPKAQGGSSSSNSKPNANYPRRRTAGFPTTPHAPPTTSAPGEPPRQGLEKSVPPAPPLSPLMNSWTRNGGMQRRPPTPKPDAKPKKRQRLWKKKERPDTPSTSMSNTTSMSLLQDVGGGCAGGGGQLLLAPLASAPSLSFMQM